MCVGKGAGHGKCTFFSNSLNSSSFCLRYSSISFCASFLASLTRFDRSGVGIRWGEDLGLEGGFSAYILLLGGVSECARMRVLGIE